MSNHCTVENDGTSELVWFTVGILIYSVLSISWLWAIYKVWAMSSSTFVKTMVVLLFIQAVTWLVWLVIFKIDGWDQTGETTDKAADFSGMVCLAISYFTFQIA